MAVSTLSLDAIEDFLAQTRVAFVGVSREPHDIGTMLLKEFTGQGYEVLPVNPKVTEILGRPCFARVQDIEPTPDAVLILTPPTVTNSIVRDCAEAGVKRVWMYRAGGVGAVSEEAVQYCRQNGIDVVAGGCPMMFLGHVSGIHWVHRFFSKITGNYPRRVPLANN